MAVKGKKIWHLISNRWYSAITAYAINAAKALELQGHQCVFSPIKNTPGEKKACEAGLEVVSFSSFSIGQIVKFLKIHQSLKPDVIVLYGGPEEFLCKFLYGTPKAKLLRFQGNALKSKSYRFPRLFSFAHAHVDLFLSPSKRISHKLRKFKGVPSVSTICLGVDTKTFKPHAKANPFDFNRRPEILIFGRLDPIKGHAEFIKLFKQLLRAWDPNLVPKLPEPCLHILGLPANVSQEQLEKEVKLNELRINEDVIITCNKIADPTLTLSNACLGVISSLGSEEICRVAQEFLLCGTPIFVSGVGALEEVLFVGAGESYRGKSEPEIVSQLKKLVEKSLTETSISRDLRASMAKNLFSLHTMGHKLTQKMLNLSQ